VADEPEPGASDGTQQVRLAGGAVATSSTSCRRWRRAGQELHHIVDPRTGLPADGPWRAVSVAAATCADANAAATAAIVAGDEAEAWLTRVGAPARLVPRLGAVRHLGGWPDGDGALVEVRQRSRVYDRGAPAAALDATPGARERRVPSEAGGGDRP
jgi:thiamine biosynthesis lipoprotein